ncbi:MAG: aldolase/citrate lyase family protein [Armatimonadota bacterium]|nr:aldolase/citrate lyase family protein [Armatimonadota bacterium]
MVRIQNRLKYLLENGMHAIGHWISIPSPSIVELMATFGMDWLLIDTEHSPAGWETVEDMIRAMKGTEVIPLVRVANNDPALIKKALDRGAMGVVVPLVNTVEEARRVVSACKFPPVGIRGVAGTRANRYGMDLMEYYKEWNNQVIVVCQIETAQSLENVEAIAAVRGVDVIFIGPADLSMDLGCFQQYDHPLFQQAVERVLRAAHVNGIAAGIMAEGAEDALARIRQGFRFVAVGTDARLLAAAAKDTYEKIRKGLLEESA